MLHSAAGKQLAESIPISQDVETAKVGEKGAIVTTGDTSVLLKFSGPKGLFSCNFANLSWVMWIPTYNSLVLPYGHGHICYLSTLNTPEYSLGILYFFISVLNVN